MIIFNNMKYIVLNILWYEEECGKNYIHANMCLRTRVCGTRKDMVISMDKWKKSKFNMVVTKRDGSRLLYNTLTNAIRKISGEEYEILCDDELLNQNIGLSKVKQEMIDEGFIVEKSVDENVIVEQNCANIVEGRDELQLTILTTNACNFNCTYCYQDHLNAFMNVKTANNICQFIDNKISDGFKKLYISWFGGEPLITKKLIIEMSQKIKKIASKNRVAYFGQMTTNGYELDLPTFKELISNHILSYSITVDGTSEIHNKQRPHKYNADSYHVIMTNLYNISKNVVTNRFTIDVRTNISSNGLDEYLKFVSEFKALFSGDKRFRLVPEPIKEWGDDKQIGDIIPATSQVYDLYEKIAMMKVPVTNYLNFERANHICVAPSANGYVIDWEGNIHKCDMDIFREKYYEKNCIGKIVKDGSESIDDEKKNFFIKRDLDKYSCLDCVLYPKCMGIYCVHAIKYGEPIKCPIYNELYEFIKMTVKLKYMKGE